MLKLGLYKLFVYWIHPAFIDTRCGVATAGSPIEMNGRPIPENTASDSYMARGVPG